MGHGRPNIRRQIRGSLDDQFQETVLEKFHRTPLKLSELEKKIFIGRR
jgi:hypothetical protein